ncbi:MAG: N-acyl-L-amino acid amidohydrolase [Candidatus Amoebophilus sp. 36-38]|nr:MAG: N-acyl-L-amino acid amidohydrolase [Candidatus Amoebophilus sp. 36-38]
MEHLKERIHQLAINNQPQVVAIRRHLHANPELSFEEFNTAKFIAKTLKDLGFTVQEGIANTGSVVLIQGKNPLKKTIALRADIDALPIQEQNNIAYKSKVDGVMHACGHDVHTSSLIGTAMILNSLKDHFEGTVKLIFQPAEEKAPGGAIAMIKEGVLENPAPSIILGQHVYPILPVGKVGFTKGTIMASTDELHITVKGKGGHAASPHLAVDPILIASHLIVALQQIVSRNTDPIKPCVVSICQIKGGDTTNVIPEEVYLAGTLRTISEDWREEAKKRIIHLSQSIAEGMGGQCEVIIKGGYPATYNDPILTGRTIEAARSYLGKDNIEYVDMSMAGEDFAYFAQQIPGCFYLIGVQNNSIGINSFVHTPTFNVDEKVLAIAPGLMAWLTLNELAYNNN